jgi:hypothetical protein
VILYNVLVHNEAKYTFEFRDYAENPYYPMKISVNATPNKDVVQICEFCNELTCFKTKKIDDEEKLDKLRKNLKSDIDWNYGTKVPEFFVASCLFQLNTNPDIERINIIKYLFFKKPDIFLNYIEKFTDFIKSETKKSPEFIEVHLKLIVSILDFFKENKEPYILGDVLAIFENKLFKKNYDVCERIGNIKNITIENLSDIFSPHFTKFNLNKYTISIFERLIKAIKEKVEDVEYKQNYEDIYDDLVVIAKFQKRENDESIKDAFKTLKISIEGC